MHVHFDPWDHLNIAAEAIVTLLPFIHSIAFIIAEFERPVGFSTGTVSVHHRVPLSIHEQGGVFHEVL